MKVTSDLDLLHPMIKSQSSLYLAHHQSLAQLVTPSSLTLSTPGFTVLLPGFPSPSLDVLFQSLMLLLPPLPPLNNDMLQGSFLCCCSLSVYIFSLISSCPMFLNFICCQYSVLMDPNLYLLCFVGICRMVKTFSHLMYKSSVEVR